MLTFKYLDSTRFLFCFHPHTASQLIHESARAAYLVRPHFAATALDRLATRPFPIGIERRWLAYQAVRAVAAAHAAGVCHGAWQQ